MTETTSTTPSIRPSAEEAELKVGYLAGASQELRRVVWPTREELFRMTSVVVLTVVAIAVFIGVIDLFLAWATQPLYGHQ